ncbi:MAG: hypothetical protein JNL42_19100 [Anaerolineae bacterium]|nr:hypothetical protein [Anaerolineae bacterium]
MSETRETIEPISGEQARAILEAAIAERLGAHWRDEDSGWQLVTGHDFMARLTRGRVNVDFYVDLLGQVTVQQSEITGAQDSGRLIAWVFLLLSLGIAFLMARIVGWL